MPSADPEISLRYQEFAPDDTLAPWVKCFWLLEDSHRPGDGPTDPVVPDGCPEVIIHYGDRFMEGGESAQSKALVAGQLTRPLLLRPSGRVGMVAARFRPDGAFAFFGLPMHELADRRVPLDAVCTGVSALEDCITHARSDRERMTHLSTFLKRQLARRDIDTDPLVRHHVQTIVAAGGQISLDQLSRSAGATPRQMERRFQARVGISPKLFCRIVRFRAIFDRLQEGPEWPRIALRCGFFDQSHLIRDFKQFAGQSPTVFLSSQSAFARCFTS